MLCEICRRKDGEYQCKGCRRIVCEDCVRYTKEGVFCGECKKDTKEEKATVTTGSKGIKSLFFTLLFLTLGLGALLYGGLYFLDIYSEPLEILNMPLESMKTAAYIIIGGSAGITLVLGFLYLFSRKTKGI